MGWRLPEHEHWLSVLVRYCIARVPAEQRLCTSWKFIEDEFHGIMLCPIYTDIRGPFMRSIVDIIISFNNKA